MTNDCASWVDETCGSLELNFPSGLELALSYDDLYACAGNPVIRIPP